MTIKIISQQDYKTSSWSGGETTEVFLYPPDGDFGAREFDFRISTAKVNLAQSDFTPLIGFERLLMSLDNSLELHHKSDERLRQVKLQPFEVASFSGSDETKSFGKCQDFNLIYLPKYEGKMAAKYQNEVTHLDTGVTCIYYALKPVNIQIEDSEKSETIALKEGESLLLEELVSQIIVKVVSKEEVSNMPLVVEVIVVDK